MYLKPKPSRINGEIPESNKAIAMAQEIHYAIEKKGSVTLHHDGVDDGGDDDVLVRHVDELTSGRRVQPTPPSDLVSDAENEGQPVVRNEHGEGAASIYKASANTEEDDVAAGGDLRWPGDSDPQVIDTDALISTHISTHNGTNYDPEQPHREASLAEETNQFETTTEAPEVDNVSDIRQERGNSASAHSKRSSGRPRRSSHEIIPSQASHGGPLLARDPSTASADTEEIARYRGLATVSNRLGGRDLRIFRANFEEMGGRPKTPESKRTSVEATNTPTDASNKKSNARNAWNP
ncbi:hypothetical protein DVH05_024931 [Phytophthora capsici]|nr:hypothetical protein DVH05_024931 [Phytophthora capsici]